ncbi:hypothetical protein BASA50_004980 [Batrachochytrium salamandrivorans]|uniref:NIPSNAP domain-containing protein n=1 Tax=Batrachochytrium salamandrivorans TaxID=1357716 RepID=A0ABQ8FEK9_9FUNG|nr:hypothetical protein BASA62_000120 [Batrachochytrium salamandrivorans]KAH6560798.1 hypothetical protein BASA60_000521 [Batrachochytrium salamandrivorans]KAH6594861.1 hypothetical protein BASA61_003951 [Batrachochytrium salamandrivorans]KAH6596649.1 hypothetical protein BASA50_004980 [Batrachochytrium salamandrivorans]KAH9248290.1 hypothetical protein BASA81_014044 [Batrachochytrium salamandrivorans]
MQCLSFSAAAKRAVSQSLPTRAIPHSAAVSVQVDPFTVRSLLSVRSNTPSGIRLLSSSSPSLSSSGSEKGSTDPTATPSASPTTVKSVFSSILRGAPAEKGGVIEELSVTYSKLMARGKYVHELQVHNVKPEAIEDYTALICEHYPRISKDQGIEVKLFGSWTTEIGELDQAIHIWEYNHYPGYIQTKGILAKDELHQAFQRKLRPMLRSRENQMMLEFAFWSSAAASKASTFDDSSIYELRTYLLKPGRMLEWEQQWRRGLEARSKFVQPVGAWFSQLGHLNYVHHMWAYPDLQVRKEMREKAWEVEGWSQTVHKTVGLINHMQARIVTPMPFSLDK